MKLLFIPIFAVLTVVVCADQFVSPPVRYSSEPMGEVVTVYEMPSYSVPNRTATVIPKRAYSNEHSSERQSVTPDTYTVEKPTEMFPILPMPEPPAPLLPAQDNAGLESSYIIRGQDRTIDELDGYLGTPPPIPQGAVEEGTVDPKLTGTPEPSETEDVLSKNLDENLSKSGEAGKESAATDPLGYAVLLTATVITTIGLVYMAFVAYDYRQRWMQSLTMQNDRYLGGGAFDMVELEDTYGTYGSGSVAFPDGFGLSHPSI